VNVDMPSVPSAYVDEPSVPSVHVDVPSVHVDVPSVHVGINVGRPDVDVVVPNRSENGVFGFVAKNVPGHAIRHQNFLGFIQ